MKMGQIIFNKLQDFCSLLFVIFLFCYAAGTYQNSMDIVEQCRLDFIKRCYIKPYDELCTLPEYPYCGGYTVVNRPTARPGDVLVNVSLISYITGEDEKLAEVTYHTCLSGVWTHTILSGRTTCSSLRSEEDTKSYEKPEQQFKTMDMPLHAKTDKEQESVLPKPDFKGDDCRLEPHRSVRYWCGYEDRVCDRDVAHGDVVTPECANLHYSIGPLAEMVCDDGRWNHVATCLPECGTNGYDYPRTLAPGREAKISELPWHVGIYSKDFEPFKQICGGSIIATTLVISAAHCFWGNVEKLKQPARFAVVAGQLERSWDHRDSYFAQRSNVADIKIPPRFRGSQTNFQDDIALVFLETPLVYNPYVLPVCLDFDLGFDRQQLTPGNLGQVAGWGLTSENGAESPVLLYENLPYVDINRCINEAPPFFREFVTSDKICSGYTNGTALCRGDSGGGLVFRGQHQSREKGNRLRFYLRGIASTAPSNENLCNLYAITSFTHLLQHEHFIKDYYNGTY